jgi:DNA polymerase III delta subunit
MILILGGADQLSVRRRLQQLKDDADGGTGMLTANFVTIDGREAKPFDILQAAMTPPFLAPRRLVLVENFLGRFAQRAIQGPLTPRAQAGPAAAGASAEDDEEESQTSRAPADRSEQRLEAFEPVLKELERGMPPSTTLVFMLPLPETSAFSRGARGTGRNAMVERLKKIPGAEVEDYPELKAEALLRHIREEAAVRGLRLRNGPPSRPAPDDSGRKVETDPAALIGALCQGDTLQIANELDKLALFTRGREATVDDVGVICAGDREARLFDFSDAVMDGNLRKALHLLGELQQSGQSDQALMAFLLGRFRTLASVVDLVESGATTEEIGAAMGNPGRWPNIRDAAIRRARRLTGDGLRATWATFVEADRTFKLGEVDDDLALELLVTRLCRMAAPTR